MQTLRDRLNESLAAVLSVLRNPDLRRIQLAFAGSEIGSWGYSIALSVIAYEAGGAKALGLLALILMLVPAITSPFMAILGDRHDRARVMMATDLVRVMLMAGAAVVAFADGATAIIYAVAALSSAVGTAFRPAEAALLPSLARTPAELTAANAASSTIESVTSFVGPAVGGIVVAVADPGVSFAVASGTFLWSALLIARIRPPEGASEAEEGEEGAEPEGILETVTAGARTIVVEPNVRLLVGLFGAQTVVAGTLLVLLPLLALEVLDSGESGLGALNAALGIGGLVGAVAAFGLVGRQRLVRPFAIGMVLWGAPLAVLAFWGSQAGAVVLLAVVGLANTVSDVAGYTLLQRAVPDRVLARVFGALESIFYATAAVGGVAAAALVGAFGIEWALVAIGAFLPALTLLLWRPLDRIDAAAPAPTRALTLLEGVPFLARLPGPALGSLGGHAVFVQIPAGEVVIREGDRGDRFYVIEEGEVDVSVAGDERPALGPGDSFGEIALLRDVPRTATITARTALTLLALERDEFLAAVTGHAPSHEAAGAVVETRLTLQRPGRATV
ncbi:MAG: MFS transporter [Gaiellales bacterium]